MTNAHVVAGQQDTTVQLGGAGPGLPAKALVFDPHDDIAILRVEGLAGRVLPIASQPRSGASGAILGFPQDGPYDVRAARLGSTRAVITQDAYGRGPVQRSIVTAPRHGAPGQLGRPHGRRERARGGHRVRRRSQRSPRAATACPTRSSSATWAGQPAPRCPPGPVPAELPCGVHGQDPRHRREAVRGPGPRPRAARSVREAHRRGRQDRPLAGGPRARHHLGRRPPRPARRARRVRRQVQEVADGRPADRPARLQARRARRALREADEGGARPAAPRRRRAGRQRVRRRARGRADLHLHLRVREGQEARPAPVAELDDQPGDARGLRPAARRRRSRRPARRGQVALGGRLDRRHERHARGDDPPALLVRRRRLARARADADAGHHRPARGGDPRLQAREVLAGRRCLRGRRGAPLRGPLPRRRAAAAEERRRGAGDRRCRPRRPRRDHQARQDQAQGAPAAAVRPHVAAARGQHALRLQCAPHAGRRAALLRGAQGADLSAHELALPDQRHGPGVQADRRPRRAPPRVPRGGELRAVARPAAARPRGRRRQGRRPPRDHPHQLRPRPREDERRRPPHLRPGRAALPRRLPSRGRVREHARGDDGRRAHLPHARQGAARAGLARRLRRAVRTGDGTGDDDEGRDQQLPAPGARRGGRHARGRGRSRRRPSRRGATATPRCWAPWRRPASSSTTTSCARR